MNADQIRKEAAQKMQGIELDPHLLALVEDKPCNRCNGGAYSTARGEEGCRTCGMWKPGRRPTVAGLRALRRAHIDAELRRLRIEYVMARDLVKMGEMFACELEMMADRGKRLRAEMEA